MTEDEEPTMSEQAVDEALSVISKSEHKVKPERTASANTPSDEDHETIDSVLNEVSRSSDEDMNRTLNDSGLIGIPNVSFGKAAVIFMIIGLIITILAVLSGGRLLIPPLRQWNAIIGVFLIGYGFLLSIHWH